MRHSFIFSSRKKWTVMTSSFFFFPLTRSTRAFITLITCWERTSHQSQNFNMTPRRKAHKFDEAQKTHFFFQEGTTGSMSYSNMSSMSSIIRPSINNNNNNRHIINQRRKSINTIQKSN